MSAAAPSRPARDLEDRESCRRAVELKASRRSVRRTSATRNSPRPSPRPGSLVVKNGSPARRIASADMPGASVVHFDPHHRSATARCEARRGDSGCARIECVLEQRRDRLRRLRTGRRLEQLLRQRRICSRWRCVAVRPSAARRASAAGVSGAGSSGMPLPARPLMPSRESTGSDPPRSGSDRASSTQAPPRRSARSRRAPVPARRRRWSPSGVESSWAAPAARVVSDARRSLRIARAPRLVASRLALRAIARVASAT